MLMLVVKSVTGMTNTGAPYMSLLLQDNSGTIDAKIWDVKADTAKLCKTGGVLMIKGQVNLYQNNLQLKVIELAEVDQSTIDIKEFLIAAPVETAELEKGIEKAVSLIKNEILSDVVTAMLEKYKKELYEYPAASRNHHDFVGGLAFHITTMVDLALKVCEVYPSLNRDLLLAGVLLHDLGKIKELSGPIATEYTNEGKLIGHISLMQSEIAEYAKSKGFGDSEEVLLLRHLVLSHHGEYDFGSPVLPLVKEAEVLSFIDNIDARITMIDKAVSGLKPGEFAQRAYSLENRSFYKSKLED